MKLLSLFIVSFLILIIFISGCAQKTARPVAQPQAVTTTIPQVSQEVARTHVDMDSAIDEQLSKIVNEQTEDLSILERELLI